MNKLFNFLSGESYKNKPNSAGFYLLDAGEALLKEASDRTREDYDDYLHLLLLHRIERLLDALRATRSDGFSQTESKAYRKREEAFRQHLFEFQSSLKNQDAVHAIIKAQTESDDRESNFLSDIRYKEGTSVNALDELIEKRGANVSFLDGWIAEKTTDKPNDKNEG
jgi:CRISPR/Cas system-associated protein endoribonuclease Cas2